MNANRANDLQTVLTRLKAQPEALRCAKIVGRWVWITFTAKPSADIRDHLKNEGFIWNRQRNAWQHSCGIRSKNAPYDPRQKYGEVDAERLIAV